MELIAQSPIGNPDVWAQYGPLGLVVFALFAVVIILIRQNAKFMDYIQAHTRATVEATAEYTAVSDKIATRADRIAERQDRMEQVEVSQTAAINALAEGCRKVIDAVDRLEKRANGHTRSS